LNGFTIIRTGIRLTFLALLVYASVRDIKEKRIPNGCLLTIAFLSLPEIVFSGITPAEHLAGSVLISMPLLAAALVFSGAIGGGDIKLLAAGGLFLGMQKIVTAFVIGIYLAGAFCVYLLLFQKGERKTAIALGPFLCIGMAAALWI